MVGRLDGRNGSRIGRRAPVTVAMVLAALLVAVVGAGPAAAAGVSGAVKKARGYQVVVVQADGTAKKATIRTTAGRFAIRGVRIGNATLHLVKADGSYFGPIVLKAGRAAAYATVKGGGSLKIGTVTLKRGYALAKRVPKSRVQTAAAYTVRAKRGTPVGAGKLGRVRTTTPRGLQGAGGDLDRDGIVGAFDIDDNGNLILDNVDRTGRGSRRPNARLASTRDVVTGARSAQSQVASSWLRDDPAPAPPPGPGPQDAQFRVFSNFKLTDRASINVNIPGIADVDALIARELPRTVSLATQIVGGATATLDGLGNSYCLPHTVDGVAYPRVNGGPATYSGTSLALSIMPGGMDAQISPGALPTEIGAGDCFLQTAAGSRYPGTLNFVFNTAPALQSYRFDTDAAATMVSYESDGGSVHGMTPGSRLVVPSGATAVTLTWWRPQRKATAGEPGGAGAWIDIGGLMYNADIPNAAKAFDGGPDLPGSHDARGAYSNASANGVTIPIGAGDEGVVDPTVDRASSATNTVSFTVSFRDCFSEWATFGSGAVFDFDIQAKSLYGDNAARKLYFILE